MDNVFDIISKEHTRQIEGIELIASENFVSDEVLKVAGSILTNKYAEGYPAKRYYGGCEFVDQIENLAIDRLKELFGAAWANVQPHSGSQANCAAMAAVLKPGDSILGFDLAHGGHLTHGFSLSFSGILYNPHFYGVDPDTYLLNYDKISEIANKVKPKLIICGASAYSRDWDYEKFRKIADENGAYLMADIAHPAGLIAKGLLNNPIKHCHFITSTTHKTLRGPRGGVIFGYENFEIETKDSKGHLRTQKISDAINTSVFPGTQGGPLMHIIGAKAVAFEEALTDRYTIYTKNILKNSKTLEKELTARNFNIISGGTDNHLLLIDLSNKSISGKEAEKLLDEAGITVNKNMIPFDTKSAFITSGIRIGTAAMTTRGLNEADMQRIVGYIDEVISKKNSNLNNKIKNEISTWMKNYPLHAK